VISTYQNAYLTRHRLDADANAAVGALYTESGELIEASQRDIGRRDRWHLADPRMTGKHDAVGKYQAVIRPTQTGTDVFLERAIFGGHLFHGWGHVLTESVSTAWAADELPDWPVVYLPWARVPIAGLRHRYEALRLGGWGNREILLMSADCVFGTVHVPQRLVRLDENIHERQPINQAQNVPYDRMVAHSPTLPPTGPVMLVRPTGHRREHPMEAEVTKELVDAGVRAVQGWTMSVTEQVAIADAAPALIGFSGSNLHNSVFAKRGARVVEIQDGRGHRVPRSLQDPLCELRNQPFTRVPGFEQGRPRAAAEIVADVLRVALGC
jgi:hypothetical protein